MYTGVGGDSCRETEILNGSHRNLQGAGSVTVRKLLYSLRPKYGMIREKKNISGTNNEEQEIIHEKP